jgi:hypothetical protein
MCGNPIEAVTDAAKDAVMEFGGADLSSAIEKATEVVSGETSITDVIKEAVSEVPEVAGIADKAQSVAESVVETVLDTVNNSGMSAGDMAEMVVDGLTGQSPTSMGTELFGDAMGTLGKELGEIAQEGGIGQGILEALEKTGEGLEGEGGNLGAIGEAIAEAAQTISESVNDTYSSEGTGLGDLIQELSGGLDLPGLQDMGEMIPDCWGGMEPGMDYAPDCLGGMPDIASSAADAIQSMFN